MLIKAVESENTSTVLPKTGARIAKDRPQDIFATERTVALMSDSISRFIQSMSSGKE